MSKLERTRDLRKLLHVGGRVTADGEEAPIDPPGLTYDERQSARGTRVGKDVLRSNANWDRFVPAAPVTGDPKLGICCSGGGLRSAAFNLGALQVLRETHALEEAAHLAAVSGGNYIAAAHLITAAQSEQGLLAEHAPWAPGSPEERYLRNHSTYLASGLQGTIWLGLNLVYGMVLNFLPFFLTAVVLGRLLGWLLAEELQPGLKSGRSVGFVEVRSWVGWIVLMPVAVGFLVVLYRRFNDRTKRIENSERAERLESIGVGVLLTGALFSFVLVGVPLLIRLLRSVSASGEAIVADGDIDVGIGSSVEAPTQTDAWFIASVVVGVLILVAAGTVLLARAGKLRRVVFTGAAIAGPGLLLVPFVAAVNTAAAWGLTRSDLILVIVCIFVLVGHGVFLHNTRYSMHLFYKQRLSSVFALARKEEREKIEAKPLPYEKALMLSKLAAEVPAEGHSSLPELVVCAAVNISDDTVPPGRRSGSFTFTAEQSGGFLTDYTDTASYEGSRGVSATTLTLPAMMAISGAALSPMMGRLTIAPLRFLMAIANVRLGVWLPNPRRLNEFKQRDERRRKVGAKRLGVAIEDAPPDAAKAASRIRTFWWHIVDGWYEPGGLYVLREAMGMTALKHRFVYVSDGGHWENLGLVELIRRGCTDIICLDASGDDLDELTVLGSAVGLARSELGVSIDIIPGALHVQNTERGWSESSVVHGTFAYPGEDDVVGNLYYAKASMTEDAPWDLQAFKLRDPVFPNHSTSDQFFDDERFESYRALGRHIAEQTIELRAEVQGSAAPTG